MGVFSVLLNEAMQHHQSLIMKAQNQPGNILARQAGAYFPQSILEDANERHPNRPAELHPHEIEANSTPVLPREPA